MTTSAKLLNWHAQAKEIGKRFTLDQAKEFLRQKGDEDKAIAAGYSVISQLRSKGFNDAEIGSARSNARDVGDDRMNQKPHPPDSVDALALVRSHMIAIRDASFKSWPDSIDQTLFFTHAIGWLSYLQQLVETIAQLEAEKRGAA